MSSISMTTIRAERSRRSLSLAHLALVAGISHPHLQRLDSGLSPLLPEKAAVPGQVLGVDPDALLRGHQELQARLRARVAAELAEAGP